MSRQQSQTGGVNQQSQTDTVNLQTAALYGAGAYAIGLVLTILAVETEIIDELAFYQLLDFEGYLLAQLVSHELNILTDGSFFNELLPMAVLMAILLIAVGYFAASQYEYQRDGDGAKTGAAIAIGYLAAAVVAVVIIFIQTDDVDTTETVLTLFVTGIIYPVVFGGIGGLLAENV